MPDAMIWNKKWLVFCWYW